MTVYLLDTQNFKIIYCYLVFFPEKFKIAVHVKKKISASLLLAWMFLQCYVLFKYKKWHLPGREELLWSLHSWRCYVLLIWPPGEGSTRDTLSQIICSVKRNTARSKWGREVALAQPLVGSLCCSPSIFSLISTEDTSQWCFKLLADHKSVTFFIKMRMLMG